MRLVEQNKRECKVCGQIKDRILQGKFDKVNKKWSDGSGLLWNGNVCPQCHVVRCRENMRKVRSYGSSSA